MSANPAISKPRLIILLLACGTSSLQFFGTRLHNFDPLVMRVATLLLLIALLIGVKVRTKGYGVLVQIGLAFAVAGEVFFIKPNDELWFTASLACYLVTNLLYMAAFSSSVPWRARDLVVAIPFVASAAVLFYALRPSIDVSHGPIAAYAVAVSMMGWRAAVRAFRRCDLSSLLACVGAVLFFIADSFLGWYMFQQAFAWSLIGVVVSYDAAQVLVALSVLFDVQRGPQPVRYVASESPPKTE